MKIVTFSYTREFDQQLPELISCERIHPGGGFVEDEDLRRMDERDRKRKALPDAERQGIRQRLHDVEQLKAPGKLQDPRRYRARRRAGTGGRAARGSAGP
jgi:hypothetical protein